MSLMERTETCQCELCTGPEPERPDWVSRPQHGATTYRRFKCRCPSCVDAFFEQGRRLARAKQAEALAATPPELHRLCNLCGMKFPTERQRNSHEARCEF